MEKKQTALQTLIAWGDEMMKQEPMKVLSFAEAIDRAVKLLEMEKKEMKRTWQDGFSFESPYKNFEQYYNETYKTIKD
jgi:hypothetical protein